MVAIPLLKGGLTAADYEDDAAADPRVDALRAKMEVTENAAFTKDYLDPTKRSIGNAIQVFFQDGTSTARVAVEYPVGHRRRRQEGIPLLRAKFDAALRSRIPSRQADVIQQLFSGSAALDGVAVDRFMDLFAL